MDSQVVDAQEQTEDVADSATSVGAIVSIEKRRKTLSLRMLLEKAQISILNDHLFAII